MKIIKKGMILIAFASLVSGCAKTNQTNNYNEPYKREAKVRPQPITSSVLMFQEIGITAVEVVIYGNENTCDLNIINLSSREIDPYTITREEYMMIQDKYQKFKEKLDKNPTIVASYEPIFEFSIKIPEIETKEAILYEINYSNSSDDYPNDYKEYFDLALKKALSGEITKRFVINPFSKENSSYTVMSYIHSKIDNEEEIIFSNNYENLVIEKKLLENSDFYELTSFGEKITTVYRSSSGGLEKFITDLKTRIVTKIYNDNSNIEVVLSYNPNTYATTIDNKDSVVTPKKYKEYLYYDYIIAFTTISGKVYMDVYNQETKKLIWRQEIDDIKQISIEFQMMIKLKIIIFDLNDSVPDTLVDFQVPSNNFVSEKYVTLKEYIIDKMNQQVKNATVTITDEEFKVEVASENQYFRIGQVVSIDSQCFYYEMKDDEYSLTYRILENKCEIDYIGSNINWTIIDDNSETLKFRDNLDKNQELKFISYFNLEQGIFVLNGEKTVLFPVWLTD